jgi:hypothetical protein
MWSCMCVCVCVCVCACVCVRVCVCHMLSLSFRYTVEFTPTDTEEVPEVCVAVLSAKGPPLTKD